MFSNDSGSTCHGAAISLWMLLAVALPAQAQLLQQAEDQIAQQANALARQPVRVALNPESKGVTVGKPFQVNVTLLSADGKPIPAKQDRNVSVELELPSGAKTTQTLVIPKGASSTVAHVSSPEAGLTSITARPSSSDIRPAKTDLLVLPVKSKSGSAKQGTAAAGRKPTSRLRSPDTPKRELLAQLSEEPTFRPARFEVADNLRNLPAALIPPQTDGGAPRLQLRIDNAGSDYIANGSDAAVIGAYFESPDGKPAPQDIHIWLTFSRGSLKPGVLQISKGSYYGSTRLTSNWPADVHVAFVSSNPDYPLAGSTDFDVQFVPLGVVLNGPAKLSVIDNVPVLVVFVNDHGPIAPGKDWPVKLLTTKSKLAFTPDALIVKSDSPLGSAMLLPRSVGSDSIQAVVSDYQPSPLEVEITWKLILALFLGGGVLGGIASYEQLKGSWFWCIFLGLLGGAFLPWVYVFLALPITVVGSLVGNVAHNTISVFFVSVLGGYLGIKVIDLVAKKSGLLT